VSRASLFVPLGLFLLVLSVGGVGFFLSDPHALPSALVGKPFPEFRAPVLGEPGRTVGLESLRGAPVMVNVWATWCPTCLAEHAELLRIGSESGMRIVGINYKDDPDAAMEWLERYGNPYELVIEDRGGELGVELGVYGAPETFLLDRTAKIVYKHVGDVNARVWQDEFVPRIAKLAGG
jgi:cytochrome c biogenesis protein CcmG/thiol:disulfide interchange protein DsbE